MGISLKALTWARILGLTEPPHTFLILFSFSSVPSDRSVVKYFTA